MAEENLVSVEQEETKKEDRKCCVYIHENVHNGKKYVGWTSKTPKQRWQNGYGYLRKYDNGKYIQPIIANALLKYNDWDNDWNHIIVENNLTEEEAKKMEIYLIALYKTNCYKYNNPTYGYNCTDGGDGITGYKMSDEQKEAIRKRAIDRLSDPKNNPWYGMGEPVVQLTLEGDFVSEYVSASEAAKMLGVWEGSIRRTCYDHAGAPYGYLWRFKKDYDPSKVYLPQYTLYKAVVQLTKDGEFIDRYDSIADASRATNTYQQSISNCCNGDIPSTGDFLWIYESEYNPKEHYKFVDHTVTGVIQLTMNYEFIEKFESITKASKITGVGSSAICKCCNNKSKSSGGFRWMKLNAYEDFLKNNI